MHNLNSYCAKRNNLLTIKGIMLYKLFYKSKKMFVFGHRNTENAQLTPGFIVLKLILELFMYAQKFNVNLGFY